MRVLLTSAGLETEKIKARFMNMLGKAASEVKALFIPTAAIDADAVEVLPKCMNDLLKCGIQSRNICVFDLHTGMDIAELRKYDVVYFCGGNTAYLIERVNDTGFSKDIMAYIEENGMVIGVSAGSLLFSNHRAGSLGLLNTGLDVHCPDGETVGKVKYPLKDRIRLTNTRALVIHEFPDGMEIIGE